MKKILIALAVLTQCALAQNTVPYYGGNGLLQPVVASPSGNSCTAGAPALMLISTGIIYTCQGGVYTAVSGSGTFTALSGDATSTATGGATTVNGLKGNALPSLTTGYLNWTGTAWAFSAAGGGTTTNAVTFNNGGSGAASGATFNGSAAVTVSYNTLGASPLAGSTSLTTLGTITTGTWNGSVLAPAYGGNGVANTATDTLGTANQNWATLGTGIVKNTTTTGALSNAASSDVIGLWSGTCNSSSYLNGAGACSTPSGAGNTTSTSLTSGTVPVANGANSIVNSLYTDNGTSGAYSGTGGFSAPSMATSGSGAGQFQAYNSAGTFYTAWSSAATANNTINGPATVPANNDFFYCAVSSTTCTLTDSGITYSSLSTASNTQAFTNKTWNGIVIGSGYGGTGVNNTATLTLGTSNQNWASLGTGIVKNTTTTGALSDAASSDVIGLWSGTCSSSTFLRGDGSCQTPSGSGTVTASAQYDIPYYPTTGTVATVQGVGISGFVFASTSAAPAAATATQGFTLLGAGTATQMENLFSALTGCTTANYVFVAASGTCVAQSGSPTNYYTATKYTGIGPTSFTPTYSLEVFDATATTGNTSELIAAGAGQSADLLDICNNTSCGTNYFKVSSSGGVYLSSGISLGSGPIASINGHSTASGPGVSATFYAPAPISVTSSSNSGVAQTLGGNNGYSGELWTVDCSASVATAQSGGTASVSIAWTDQNGAQTQTLITSLSLASKPAQANGHAFIQFASGNVTFTPTYGGTTGGTFTTTCVASQVR